MTRRKTKTPASEEQQPADLTFEKAMSRLEMIVSRMEEGTMPLDAMMAAFEEGQRLITFCSSKLNEVEARIDILVRKDGDVKEEPFHLDDEDEESEPESESDRDDAER